MSHASDMGATLMCFKKAHHFGKWIAEQNTSRYVLFTDRREIKHCVDAVKKPGVGCRPIFTVVICTDDKQRSKAQSWVASLGFREDPIFIFKDLASVQAIAPRLLHVVQALKAPKPSQEQNMHQLVTRNCTRGPPMHCLLPVTMGDMCVPPSLQLTCLLIGSWDGMQAPCVLLQPVQMKQDIHPETHPQEDGVQFSRAAGDSRIYDHLKQGAHAETHLQEEDVQLSRAVSDSHTSDDNVCKRRLVYL